MWRLECLFGKKVVAKHLRKKSNLIYNKNTLKVRTLTERMAEPGG